MTSPSADRQWFIVSRWQEFQGEARANLLRTICVGAFYIIELINHGVQIGPLQLPKLVGDQFHRSVTGLAIAWTMVALVTHVCLRRQFFPAATKYITTACDLAILTAVLTIADGPRSPIVVAYFLILALAALRLSLRLVSATTIGAIVSYMFLLGFVKYYAATDRATAMNVPRYYELIILVALALTGVILGQVIRQMRTAAEDYSRRTARQ